MKKCTLLAVLTVVISGCMLPGAAEKTAAMQKIRDGALLVDVRSPKEFRDGGYANATNIPYREIERLCDELDDRDRPVVVYCHSGIRSGIAKRTLEKAGFSDVVNAGGLSGLQKRGRLSSEPGKCCTVP